MSVKSDCLIRLLLVDDHFFVRMGLASSLNDEEDLEVVAEASTVEEAVQMQQESAPDVALIDFNLPDGDGPEEIEKIMGADAPTRCIILSVAEGEDDIYRAVQAGACGYLPKSTEREEVLSAIRAVAAGETFFPEAVQQRLNQRSQRPELTARETEVLLLVVEGLLNKEIADRLGLAEITVKQHVSSILRKLDVQDRTQAAVAAVERGMVRLKG